MEIKQVLRVIGFSLCYLVSFQRSTVEFFKLKLDYCPQNLITTVT